MKSTGHVLILKIRFMQTKKKILLLVSDSNGCYPVPASKGGAVTTLVESLIQGNEKERLVEFEVLSYWDKKAEELSARYPNTFFRWVRVPGIIKVMDKILFFLVTTLTNKKANSFISLTALLWYIWKASRLLKKEKYDSVVLEHNILQIWALRLVGYYGDYYYHLHNIPRVNAGSREWFWRCNKLMCVSQYMVDDIESEQSPIGPVPIGRGVALYNCIDTEQFRPIGQTELSEWREKYGIGPTDKVLVYAGRLTWEKGIDKVLDALDYIQTENVKLLIVGAMMMSNDHKDEYYEKLQTLASRHGDRVKFTGYVNHDELQYVYNIADIAVLPSMWEEPAGLTMIEAMACGIPTITTRSGGIPEYVGDCAVVLERDEHLPENIAMEVDRLLNDKTAYDWFSAEGCKRIRENFSLKDYLRKFVEIL